MAKFTISSNTYEKAGQVIQMDAVPYIESGRTFIPVRFLANAIDADVQWDPSTQKVEIHRKNASIDYFMAMYIGQTYVDSWGQAEGKTGWQERYTIDVAPVIRNGRTYLPAVYVVQYLEVGTASWDENTQTVAINRGGMGGR